MCQGNESQVPAPKSTRSPWRRFLRQPVRPKLPRSVVPGARINLNLYWNKFEEVISLHRAPNTRLVAPLHRLPVTNATDDNAINDNLVNERAEFGNLINLNSNN